MADRGLGSRKPRIRKTAPTVREMAEARAKDEAKPQRRPRLASAKQLPKISLPKNPFFNSLAAGGRKVGKVLSWLTPKYFVNSWRELRQVTWTNRRETWRLTFAVFIFALVFGALVAGVDKGLDEIFKKLVLR